MANDVIDWTLVYFRIEDPATPGTWLRPCVLTSQTWNQQNDLKEVKIPACPPVTGETWRRARVDLKKIDFSGDGYLYSGSQAMLRDWYLDAGSKRNVQWFVDLPLADGGGTYEGLFVLESLEFSSGQDDNDGYVGFQLAAKSDGEVAWTDAAA